MQPRRAGPDAKGLVLAAVADSALAVGFHDQAGLAPVVVEPQHRIGGGPPVVRLLDVERAAGGDAVGLDPADVAVDRPPRAQLPQLGQADAVDQPESAQPQPARGHGPGADGQVGLGDARAAGRADAVAHVVPDPGAAQVERPRSPVRGLGGDPGDQAGRLRRLDRVGGPGRQVDPQPTVGVGLVVGPGPVGHHQHLGHAGVGGEGPVGRPGVGDGHHADVAVVLVQQGPHLRPGLAGGHHRGQHEGDGAARLDLGVGQVDEVRRQTGVAAARRVGQAPVELGQSPRHGPLLGGLGVESREGRHRHPGRLGRSVVGGPGERRVHYH